MVQVHELPVFFQPENQLRRQQKKAISDEFCASSKLQKYVWLESMLLGHHFTLPTVFKNHIKSPIQHCKRSEHEERLHLEWSKVN